MLHLRPLPKPQTAQLLKIHRDDAVAVRHRKFVSMHLSNIAGHLQRQAMISEEDALSLAAEGALDFVASVLKGRGDGAARAGEIYAELIERLADSPRQAGA